MQLPDDLRSELLEEMSETLHAEGLVDPYGRCSSGLAIEAALQVIESKLEQVGWRCGTDNKTVNLSRDKCCRDSTLVFIFKQEN